MFSKLVNYGFDLQNAVETITKSKVSRGTHGCSMQNLSGIPLPPALSNFPPPLTNFKMKQWILHSSFCSKSMLWTQQQSCSVTCRMIIKQREISQAFSPLLARNTYLFATSVRSCLLTSKSNSLYLCLSSSVIPLWKTVDPLAPGDTGASIWTENGN